MGNSQKGNHPNRKGKGIYQRNNISLVNKHIDNRINNSNIINDNSINNHENKLDVVIETLIRIFLFENKIKELCNYEYNKNNDSSCVIVSKYLIEKYKEIFQFKSLIKQFDNETILNYINILSIEENYKENKIKVIEKKEYISKIIFELNKINERSIYKIKENISLLSELNNEYNEFKDRAKLNYIFVYSNKNKRKVFIDFEIINCDIFSLLMEQNISAEYFLFADYFISFDKILILIKDFGGCSNNVICEFGKYNKREQRINIEYLLDSEKILDSRDFKDKLKDFELSNIYQKICGTKKNNNENEIKEYNFGFDNDNLYIKITKDDSKEKEEIFISSEEEYEDNKIFKVNVINLRVKNNYENKFNICGRDSDNIINGENSKVNKKENEKDINNHEKKDKILPSIQINNENKDKFINKIEEEENKEGNKSKREKKIGNKALIDFDDYIIQNNKNSENEISKLLNEQKKLNDKIKELENKLKEKDDLINDYIETINKLKKSLNENIHQNENLNENLIRKSNEIEELKKEMDQLKIKKFKFPFELSEKEELASIIITTIDENINVSFVCKNTDKFIKIEKDFYNKYPQYKNLDNYFTINGKKINPDLSLEENKINNNDVVVLYQ